MNIVIFKAGKEDNMEIENQNLIEISNKLEITDQKVIRKALEHLRLLKVKSNSLQITEYAKIVICLDVAANDTDTTFNLETALSILNYGKAKYRKEKHTIQRILNVTQMPDVKSICLSIRLSNNKELIENATRILKDYMENKELTAHPQYDAMAVYQTSKMMKIKAKEDKLIAESHLNRQQWSILKNQWNQWLEENKINLKSNLKRKLTICGESEEINDVKENVKPNIKSEEVTESYEDWKKRILTKAYADLKLLNVDNRNSSSSSQE